VGARRRYRDVVAAVAWDCQIVFAVIATVGAAGDEEEGQ
jgi:hypothetical protein